MDDLTKVIWHLWVWNSFNIPKYSFIGWLAALGRLKTKNKLVADGICSNQNCLLCDQGCDSCNHLFFRCQYNRKVCEKLLDWLGIKSNNQESLYVNWKKSGRKY